MKRLLLVALLPFSAVAANTRDNYVEQWPIAMEDAQAGAYQISLTEAVYRRAYLPSLADVEAFNAQGQTLPTALVTRPAGMEKHSQLRPLPWFPLPAVSANGGNDLRLIAERDTDGSVRRIETSVGGKRASSPGGWLFDASAVDARVDTLVLEWETPAAPLQVDLRLEASDDLVNWQVVQPRVTLVDLDNNGRRLQQRRLALGSDARYVRLLPLGGSLLPVLKAVSGEVDATASPLQWQWLSLEGVEAADHGFEFVLPGRFPVAQADIAAHDNSAVEWTLFSRESDDARWVRRAGPWVAYQLGDDRHRNRSPAQPLDRPVRDRHWRLVPAHPAAAPSLRLGYRPETLVFLAQGAPPYSLAVGSARVERPDAPLESLLGAMRQQRGQDWKPAVARLQSPGQVLAGEAALQPRRDWKAWLLWALLAGGALVVAGLALSLLRARPTDGPAA